MGVASTVNVGGELVGAVVGVVLVPQATRRIASKLRVKHFAKAVRV